MQFEYRPDKLQELMLHLSLEMCDIPTFGAVAFNKTLFLMDFLAYKRFGTPITGSIYEHLNSSPAPDRLLTERYALQANGRATMQERVYEGQVLRRLIALDRPNLDVFSESEMALIHEVIAGIKSGETAAMDEMMLGWHAAAPYAKIPYSTAFLSMPRQPTPSQVDRARELSA